MPAKKKTAKKAKPKRRKKAVKSKSGRPYNWDKRVSSAYLMLLGASQKAAAEAAGCGERTIRDWKKCRNWPEVEAEARARWLNGCDSLSMRAIVRGLSDNDQGTARWWANKRICELGGSSGTRQSPPTRPGDYGIVLSAEQLKGMSGEQLDALEGALAQGSRGDSGGDPEPDTG